jgi:hypothetical protein
MRGGGVDVRGTDAMMELQVTIWKRWSETRDRRLTSAAEGVVPKCV